jgi:RNA polymerase sigma-70 factor (ECF subfamily)
MRTATRDWFVRAREDLPAEDQMLLVLRGKGLEWDEVARVMGGESEAHNVTVRREAARLRKRFQWIKERLRDRA